MAYYSTPFEISSFRSEENKFKEHKRVREVTKAEKSHAQRRNVRRLLKNNEGNSRPSCTKEMPKKIAREPVERRHRLVGTSHVYSLYAWFTWC